MAASKATTQLKRDLKQIITEPIVGANAAPIDDSNLLKWACIVCTNDKENPYYNIPIRFTLDFPADYPATPPKAFFDTYIAYTNGAQYHVDGKLAVCLNIFGNFSHIHTEWKNQSEGWSPSYTVSTILISMQALMMSDMLSIRPSDIEQARKSAMDYKCSATGHDGSDSAKWFPLVSMEQSVSTVARTTYNPLKDFYVCYVNKSNMAEDNAVLGYGVQIVNSKTGALSSPCEYISLAAFEDGIRNSSTNKPFDHWLPILIHSQDWVSRGVRARFLKSIDVISGSAKKTNIEKVMKVSCSLMNSLVVEIMNNKNNLTANDKFINGYFAIYRILKHYATSEEQKTSDYADKALENFIKQPTQRSKTHTPNLGELIMYLTVSKKYQWSDLAESFLTENDTRNVFWYAVGTYNNRAPHPELKAEKPIADRAAKVFASTEVSRNLVMFQMKFVQVACALTNEAMDMNFGLAPEQLRKELKETYKQITSINDWNGYFTWLGLPTVTNDQRNAQLLNAVVASKKAGYHK